MDIQIDIDLEDPRWATLDLATLAARAAMGVAADRALAPDQCELSVLGCDDARIAELNAEFRGKPAPTNVLSWPAEERGVDVPGQVPAAPVPDMFGMIAFGDVAIAYETCLREAEEQQKTAQDHVTHLLVHAILHLLGYDHIDDQDAALMEETERRILDRMGIVNPYE